MSNMLYACSILYKTKLPFIVAMNKVDIVDAKYAVRWMTDFEEFQNALQVRRSFHEFAFIRIVRLVTIDNFDFDNISVFVLEFC